MVSPIPACGHDGLQPGRLWSFAEMIDRYLAEFVFGRYRLWCAYSLAESESTKDPKGHVPDSQMEPIKDWVSDGIKYCVTPLKLNKANDSVIHIDNLFRSAKFHPCTWGQLFPLIQRLWKDIELGIAFEYFFHYPHNMAKERLQIDQQWCEVIANFSSSRQEIQAAIDCNALGDYPGTVFHMMRVAEIGLRSIARERHVRSVGKNKPLEWGTWKDVFDAIEGKLKAIRSASPGPKKDAALAFYDTALSDLRTLQGLYRDRTMHFRDNYDPGQAQSAIFRTKSLMQMLATKLSENSTRQIRWGI